MLLINYTFSIHTSTAPFYRHIIISWGVGRNWQRGCSYFSFLPLIPSPPLLTPFSSPSFSIPWHPYLLPSIPPVPCPFLTSSILPPPSFPVPFSPLPLEVGPLKPAMGLGERCKLPERGPGQSPGRNRIGCTLELLGCLW